MRHKQGDSHQQSILFPESLDEYASEDNPVRVIDAFIDSLDMSCLGFTLATTKDTGRKPYLPADLMKLATLIKCAVLVDSKRSVTATSKCSG